MGSNGFQRRGRFLPLENRVDSIQSFHRLYYNSGSPQDSNSQRTEYRVRMGYLHRRYLLRRRSADRLDVCNSFGTPHSLLCID
jgi:hypothetical protein